MFLILCEVNDFNDNLINIMISDKVFNQLFQSGKLWIWK
jgi:hypothetical protein